MQFISGFVSVFLRVMARVVRAFGKMIAAIARNIFRKDNFQSVTLTSIGALLFTATFLYLIYFYIFSARIVVHEIRFQPETLAFDPQVMTTNEHILISDDLFRTAGGKFKVSRDVRFRYLGLLAQAIQDPDEIWHVWEEYPKGRWTLRRKYLARWNVDGQDIPGFALFDTGSNGWSGVTTFKAKNSAYLKRQRNGALVYRRTEKDNDND